jgi:hypothetical protein
LVDPNNLLRTWMLLPSVTLPPPDGTTLFNPILQVFQQNTPAETWPGGPPVFAGKLPEQYNPRQAGHGLAIVVSVSGSGATDGGVAHPEIPIIDPRMQVKVWAGDYEFLRARQLDCAIYDWIHGKTALVFSGIGFVLTSLNQVLGHDLTDPSGLVQVVSYYHLKLIT